MSSTDALGSAIRTNKLPSKSNAVIRGDPIRIVNQDFAIRVDGRWIVCQSQSSAEATSGLAETEGDLRHAYTRSFGKSPNRSRTALYECSPDRRPDATGDHSSFRNALFDPTLAYLVRSVFHHFFVVCRNLWIGRLLITFEFVDVGVVSPL